MKIAHPFIAVVLLAVSTASIASEAIDPDSGLKFTDVSFMDAALWRADTVADHRIRYGDGLSGVQFGDLRLPDGSAPESGFPVIVFIHGGAWRADWSKDYTEALVERLVTQGFATWDLEFRRMGNRGGGYPGTLEDVADGLDHLRELADEYPLDLANVIAMGHSSGGHLALWLAGRHHLAESSPLHREDPLPLRGVISIAGVNDLELALTLGDRTDVLELAGVDDLASGRDRLGEVDPGRLLSLGVPQVQIIGDRDADWRLDMHQRFEAKARDAGDSIRTLIVPGANHMDIVDGASGMAPVLTGIARELLSTTLE